MFDVLLVANANLPDNRNRIVGTCSFSGPYQDEDFPRNISFHLSFLFSAAAAWQHSASCSLL